MLWSILGLFMLPSLFQMPLQTIAFGIIVVLIVMLVRKVRRDKEENFRKALEAQAEAITQFGNTAELGGIALALNKGEQTLYVENYVTLTEFRSTGSTYVGGSAGVSFPLFGRVRGHVGGNRGRLVKNPEQLTVIDSGQAIFTNHRIVFVGAQITREWDFKKVIALEPGPNGVNVRIAVSNREKISGLQAPSINAFGPGYPAAFAFNWFQNGEASAKQWAKDLSKEITELVEVERAKDAKPAKAIGQQADEVAEAIAANNLEGETKPAPKDKK